MVDGNIVSNHGSSSSELWHDFLPTSGVTSQTTALLNNVSFAVYFFGLPIPGICTLCKR